MNRDFLTDELLEEAIRKACEQEYSMLDDVEEHEFSSEFEQEMEALINEKENKPIPFRRKRKIKFRYLLVAILSFALSYATVLAVEPAREKIDGYMENVSNDGIVYKMVETKPDGTKVFNSLYPEYIPDGFDDNTGGSRMIDEEYWIAQKKFTGKDNYELIYINATPAFWDIYEFNMDWNDAIAQEIWIDGLPALLIVEPNGREHVIFAKGGLIFYAGGTVGRDELIKVLESVETFQ